MTCVQWPSNDAAILRFWSLALALKRLRRQGWLDRGVRDPESVADHSWGVALLGWLLASERPELDRGRVLLLGLVHDIPEAVAGDLTPFDEARDASGAISAERFRELPSYSEEARRRKAEQEAAALEELLQGLPDDLATDVRNAWHEYEEGRTPEARFVRQVDKLETWLQAERYQQQQPELVVESFRLGALRDISDAALARFVRRTPSA